MNATQLEPVSTILDPSSLPRGFKFAGIHAGIKRSRRDLGLIHCPKGAVAAGCFTKNPVRAACIDRDMELLPSDDVRAVVVNSGNANALTGMKGAADNLALATATAEALDCPLSAVLTCSTGVIGVPLNMPVIGTALPSLPEALSEDPAPFASAILTTDTVTKVAHLQVELPGHTQPVRLLGIAKGSGMVHPNMATTLGYVCTDAAIAPSLLQRLLQRNIESTFNAITVDGDTSTNDAVVVLASGETREVIETAEAVEAFDDALRQVLWSLAGQVARDGEGATRLLEVTVSGAETDAAAAALARACCRGSLFKCSVFAGEVSGWGRLAAALGQAALENDVALDATTLRIEAQGMTVVDAGTPVEHELGELSRRLRDAEVHWLVRVGDGEGRFTALGCDLSYDYVRINADESLQLEVSPQGRIGRNLSLGAYSPTLKHQLLVDGLAYVRRFTGLRVAVQLSGATTNKPELLHAVARDLELMLDAGMRTLVVVPDPEVGERVREALAQSSAYSLSEVSALPAEITPRLDRGHACLLVRAPDPGALVELCIKLNMGKLLSLADDRGLRDKGGLVTSLTPQQALEGLARGHFDSVVDENLALTRHAAQQGLPALHLVDGRMPHALVAELFTDEGVGTMVTRSALL